MKKIVVASVVGVGLAAVSVGLVPAQAAPPRAAMVTTAAVTR